MTLPRIQASCDVQHNVLLKYQNPPPNGGSCSLIKRTRRASPILGRFHFSAVTPTPLLKSFLSFPVFGCQWEAQVR